MHDEGVPELQSQVSVSPSVRERHPNDPGTPVPAAVSKGAICTGHVGTSSHGSYYLT